MTSVTTCPPPLPATEPQHPESSPNPPKPVPVKSLSSHAMKMAELPVHAEEAMIASTVLDRKASPARIRPCTLAKRQVSVDGPPRPCMSLHWSGLIQDRKSTRLNSSHDQISYAVFCLKKKKQGLMVRLRLLIHCIFFPNP